MYMTGHFIITLRLSCESSEKNHNILSDGGKKMRRTLSSTSSFSICSISIGFDMHYDQIDLSSQKNFYNHIFDRF